LFVIGHAEDHRFWWNRSPNLGGSWRGWAPIGSGIFQSDPAAATTWNGSHMYVTGLGDDKRVWYAKSFDRGEHWNVAWTPILTKTFG
jgi:hypothetical protein